MLVYSNIFTPRNHWAIVTLNCRKKKPDDNIISRIRKIVTDVTGIDPFAETNYRMSEFVKSRQLFIYFVRKYAKLSQYATGQLLGKDHSTIVHAEKCVQKYKDNEVNYRQSFDAIESKIKNTLNK